MPKHEVKDYGTKELGRHFTVVPMLAGPHTLTGRVVDENEVDRLLMDDVISSSQHSTLVGFTQRLHKFGFFGLKSPSYDAPVNMDPSRVGDRKALLLRGMVKIFKELDKEIGTAKRKSLVNLALDVGKWKGDGLNESIAALEKIMRGQVE